jgi:hypothetical protein
VARRVRKFVDRAFAKTVDLGLVRRLLAPYTEDIGFSWDDLPPAEGARREAIFELFRTADGRFPAKLQFALFNISCLSTEAGAHLLQSHAESRGIELVARAEVEGPGDGRHLNPRYLALVAWLDHRPVFDRALDGVAFLWHSAKLELSGRREGAEPLQHDAAAVENFRRAVSEYFSSRYLGRYCDVRWYSEPGSARALVLHGSKASTKNVDAEGAEQSLTFREIVQDTLEYDVAGGTISIGSKVMPDARKLAGLFAEYLLGDAKFFEGKGAGNFYTLEPINECGAAFRLSALDDDEIAEVIVREIQVDEGEHYVDGRKKQSPWAMTVRDNGNALQRLADLAPDVDFGDLRISYVKLEFVFKVADATSSVIVKVKPPNFVSFRDHSHESAILDLLERHGIRRLRPAHPAAAAAE